MLWRTATCESTNRRALWTEIKATGLQQWSTESWKEGDYTLTPKPPKRCNSRCHGIYSEDIDPPIPLPITRDKLLRLLGQIISIIAAILTPADSGQKVNRNKERGSFQAKKKQTKKLSLHHISGRSRSVAFPNGGGFISAADESNTWPSVQLSVSWWMEVIRTLWAIGAHK